MSVQRDCVVFEIKPGEWYTAVAPHPDESREDDENYNPPGIDQGRVYGPAKTADAAFEKMSNHEANPGGYNEVPFKSMNEQSKKMYEGLVKAKNTRGGGYDDSGFDRVVSRRQRYYDQEAKRPDTPERRKNMAQAEADQKALYNKLHPFYGNQYVQLSTDQCLCRQLPHSSDTPDDTAHRHLRQISENDTVAAFLSQDHVELQQTLELGDSVGHPFRGNQYSGGSGSAHKASSDAEQAQSKAEDRYMHVGENQLSAQATRAAVQASSRKARQADIKAAAAYDKGDKELAAKHHAQAAQHHYSTAEANEHAAFKGGFSADARQALMNAGDFDLARKHHSRYRELLTRLHAEEKRVPPEGEADRLFGVPKYKLSREAQEARAYHLQDPILPVTNQGLPNMVTSRDDLNNDAVSAFLSQDPVSLQQALELGDLPGHEFRGNQYSDAAGSSDSAHASTRNTHTEGKTAQAAHLAAVAAKEHSLEAERLRNDGDDAGAAKEYLAAAKWHQEAGAGHGANRGPSHAKASADHYEAAKQNNRAAASLYEYDAPPAAVKSGATAYRKDDEARKRFTAPPKAAPDLSGGIREASKSKSDAAAYRKDDKGRVRTAGTSKPKKVGDWVVHPYTGERGVVDHVYEDNKNKKGRPVQVDYAHSGNRKSNHRETDIAHSADQKSKWVEKSHENKPSAEEATIAKRRVISDQLAKATQERAVSRVKQRRAAAAEGPSPAEQAAEAATLAKRRAVNDQLAKATQERAAYRAKQRKDGSAQLSQGSSAVDIFLSLPPGRETDMMLAGKPKCGHMNEDGTFAGGFDGCVNHMTSECGGGHSEESAKRICGAINRDKNG